MHFPLDIMRFLYFYGNRFLLTSSSGVEKSPVSTDVSHTELGHIVVSEAIEFEICFRTDVQSMGCENRPIVGEFYLFMQSYDNG